MLVLLGNCSCEMHIGEPLHICSGFHGDRAHCIDIIGLLGRWSCKGCPGKPQHICSGLQGNRAHQLSRVVLKRWP